jgi:hypothetical protein
MCFWTAQIRLIRDLVTTRVVEPVNVRDVRTIQRREDLRLTTESREAIGIVCRGWPQRAGSPARTLATPQIARDKSRRDE